jgi:hypothetical protein
MGRKGTLTARTSGVVITTPLDGGPATVEDTVQCVHCQRHRIYRPRSKTLWGYCMACAGLHCATDECATCVPAEARLENIEAGRPETHRKIIVANPGVASGGSQGL